MAATKKLTSGQKAAQTRKRRAAGRKAAATRKRRATAAKAAGAPPFKAKDLARQVKQLPREQLESWLPVLARIDLDLKGGSERPPKAILEHALIELCRG